MKALDLSNNIFGNLVVLTKHSKDNFGRWKWLCQCGCGQQTVVASGNLKTGTTKSCGCLLHKQASNFIDIINQKYGRLTVTKSVKKSGISYYECVCDCGNIITTSSSHIRNGHTKSCGCYRNDMTSKSAKKRLCGKIGIYSARYNHSISKSERLKIKMGRGNLIKQWSKNIIELNWFTCQKCKSIGGKLHAHHLDGYAKNKEKRLDYDNGVCLCSGCHKEYHSLFGLNAKAPDFYEWVGLEFDSDLQSFKGLKLDKTLMENIILVNFLKYIDVQKKDKDTFIYALEKASEYLNSEIVNLKKTIKKQKL